MIDTHHHNVFRLLIGAFLFLVLVSCVTQKSRDEELTGLGKLYHNTTAKFNGYFNANELLEASVATLEDQYQDNYKRVLPVYEYIAADNPQVVASDLDLAIEKVSVVVNLHRQSHWTDDCYLLLGKAQFLKQDYEAAEETLRWMINEFSPQKMAREREKEKARKKGKADQPDQNLSASVDNDEDGGVSVTEMTEKEKRRYYKELERERKRYNKEVRRKRKRARRGKKTPKKEAEAPETPAPTPAATPAPAPETPTNRNENGLISLNDDSAGPEPDPDSYFLKHRPAYQEGVLWLARTFIERERYEEAQRYLAQLENDRYTFPDIRDDLLPVRAHFHLRRNEHEAALPYLEQAVDAASRRADKARYAFILAQIHHQAGREQQAYAAFEKALRYGPTYEMRFNGNLYLIENGWENGIYTTTEAREELLKMARDIKNVEYRDQIFYALADLELEAGNRQAGIDFLQASLAESQSDRFQRAESYLRLANLYLLDEDFLLAQAYFDSTSQTLPNSDDRYPEVAKWAENLSGIAENLRLIQRQDSLLRLAALSPEEQQALAFEIKKERDRARLNAITRQASSSAAAANGSGLQARPNNLRQVSLSGNASQQGQTRSSFFAYDDRALKRGQREFAQRWGARTLEDDWRRKNKQALAEFAAKGDDEETVVALPEDEINSILADVPKTPEQIAEAESTLQEAMFKLGILYRQKLEDKERSARALEDLDERFSDYPREAEALYYLYLNYSELGQQAKAQQVASRLAARHPSSVYAKVLQNPDYAAEQANAEQRLNQYYEGVYQAFSNGRYAEAFAKSDAAAQQFGMENPLQPKFALLRAMSSGHLEGKEAYIANLRDLISRYPGTEEQVRAREILRLLGEQPSAVPGVTPEEVARYETNDDQIHYILIIFHQDVRLDEPQIKLSNYNMEYHKLERLRINNLYLGQNDSDRMPMLIVRRFKDKEAAMRYFEGATRNAADFIDPSLDFSFFAVNQQNYREILRSRSIGGYQEFFNMHYLQ